jgi:hypothetical protein
MVGKKLKNNTTFFYTLSSRENMFTEAVHSVKTLLNYTEPENVVVVFTPPYDDRHMQEMKDLGVQVWEKEHKVEQFRNNEYEDLRSYGDKLWITEVETKNAVLLDCDTLVLGNIWEVLEGDFDFKAREGLKNFDDDWHDICKRFDESYIDWMPNAGFLVFKNNLHREIKEKWEKYYSELENKSYVEEGGIHREQTALALAVSSEKYTQMDETEHLREWCDEIITDSKVYHLAGPQWTYIEYLREFILRTKNLNLIEALKNRI